MARKFNIIFLFYFTPLIFIAQNYPDKIFTKKGGTINCKITLVNDKNIFYEYKKRKSTRSDYILLDSIRSYNWVSQNITQKGPEEKKAIPNYMHCVGGGIAWLPDKSDQSGHDGYTIKYTFPSPNIFYRFIFITEKENKLCLTAGGNYRQSSASSYGGALGGGSFTQGTFNFVRLQIAPSFLWSLGKKKRTNLGIGIALGFLTFCSGTASEQDWSVNPPYSSSKQINVRNTINPVTLGINVELNQQIKLTDRNYLVLGARFVIEGSDGYSYRLNNNLNIFVGYTFATK